MPRVRDAAACALALVLATGARAEVAIEEVVPTSGAADAGLLAGDVVLGWERAANPPANPLPAAGVPQDPYDLMSLDVEQRHRGQVTFRIRRGPDVLLIAMPRATNWQLKGTPNLPAAQLALYQQGLAALRRTETATALEAWGTLERELSAAGQYRLASFVAVRLSHLYRGEQLGAGSLRWLEVALDHAQKNGEADVLGEIHYYLAQVNGRYGNTDEAKGHFEQSAAARALDVGKPLRYASALAALCGALNARGDLTKSEEVHRQALAFTEAEAPGSMLHAGLLSSFASVFSRRGQHEEAMALNARALGIAEALDPNSLTTAQLLHNLGASAIRRAEIEEARVFLERALAIKGRRSPGTLDYASTLNNLGIVAWSLGELARAEELLVEAQLIKERISPRSTDTATGLGNLANLALLRGDAEGALAAAEKSLQLTAELSGGSLEHARVLGMFGQILERLGRFDAAAAHLERALAIRSTQAPGSFDHADSLRKLADLERARGNLDRALTYATQAVSYLDEAAPQVLDTATALLSLGTIRLERGEPAGARPLLERSLDIRRKLAPQSFLVAESAHALGRLEREEGKPEAALAAFREAVAAIEAQGREVGGLEVQRYRFAARFARIYRDEVELLAERGREASAFAVLEQSRARSFRALLAERRLAVGGAVPPELAEARRQADAAYDRAFLALGQAAAADGGELARLRTALDQARGRQQEVKARVRALAPRAAVLEEAEPMSLARAQATLEPGTLALSYSLGDEGSLLFALGPEPGALSVVHLGVTRGGLAAAVRRFQTLVAEPEAEAALAAASASLTRDLLTPVEEKIRRAERLVIVPDGALNYLPFAALRDPTATPARFLVEAKPLFKVASLSVLADLRQRGRAQAAGTLLALGDPRMPGAEEAAGAKVALRTALAFGLELTPLPSARREVEELGALFGARAEVRVGAAATEELVKERAAKVPYLHFATHGFVDEHQPLDSGLVLAQPLPGTTSAQNGFLQAWEILEQLALDAELVTLSACSTALGEELEGEGILGLSRAFQHAGARAVLASLWQVPDESTARLMRRFYTVLRAGKTKAEALREAQLELLSGAAGETHRRPYSWAAFELLGEGR